MESLAKKAGNGGRELDPWPWPSPRCSLVTPRALFFPSPQSGRGGDAMMHFFTFVTSPRAAAPSLPPHPFRRPRSAESAIHWRGPVCLYFDCNERWNTTRCRFYLSISFVFAAVTLFIGTDMICNLQQSWPMRTSFDTSRINCSCFCLDVFIWSL